MARSVQSFGAFSCFALVTFKGRLGTEYFIEDAETPSDDGTGLPSIVFQTSSLEAAQAKRAELEAAFPVESWE